MTSTEQTVRQRPFEGFVVEKRTSRVLPQVTVRFRRNSATGIALGAS